MTRDTQSRCGCPGRSRRVFPGRDSGDARYRKTDGRPGRHRRDQRCRNEPHRTRIRGGKGAPATQDDEEAAGADQGGMGGNTRWHACRAGI
eukprot:14034669-Alexandrium_andersonii.AAC.1